MHEGKDTLSRERKLEGKEAGREGSRKGRKQEGKEAAVGKGSLEGMMHGAKDK